MRLTFRWLVFWIFLTALLFGFVYFSLPRTTSIGNLPLLHRPIIHDSNNDDPPKSAISVPGAVDTLDSIAAVWHFWSEAIHNDRPTVLPVTVSGEASNVQPIKEDTAARRPYPDLVRTSKSDVQSLRASHAKFVQRLKEQASPDVFQGRGIVLVGGGEYNGPAVIGIHMLRRAGSVLPVEVFLPDKSSYNPEFCEVYLPKLDARCVLLSDTLSHGRKGTSAFKISHYQLKSLALLFSSFAEVLLLDSDSIPLLDPSQLFENEPYVTKGLVIWPDFWIATESSKFYEIAGLNAFPADLPQTSSETGQLLINKTKHWRTLLLATYYNIYGPDYFYPLLSQGALGQGDKETFMAAAVVLNTPYYRVQSPVKHVGRHDGQKARGTAMVQYDPLDDGLMQAKSGTSQKSARPAFLHSNTPKMNAGHLVDEGDLLAIDHKTRLRLLGSEKKQIELFGLDIEKTIWELLVQTGCELADVIKEWKQRKRLCERLEEHFQAVFMDNGNT